MFFILFLVQRTKNGCTVTFYVYIISTFPMESKLASDSAFFDAPIAFFKQNIGWSYKH
jgi:hypothetical protein